LEAAVVYDDELDRPYVEIRASDRPRRSTQPPSDSTVDAILEIVRENPNWRRFPRRVYEKIREKRHDIPLDEVRRVLDASRHERRGR
jgi:hypothetical protein